MATDATYTTLELAPLYTPFFASMGVSFAMIFTSLGAAYGTAKAGTGIAATSVSHPELVMKSLIPVIMAGIIAVYGLVISVIMSGAVVPSPDLTLHKSFLYMGAGLVVGFTGLAAGYAIGVVGDAGVRGCAQEPRLYVGMILILIFAEVLGLFGFISAVLLAETRG